MSVVTIFSASHCQGDDVARLVADRLGAKLLTAEDLIGRAAARYHVSEEKLRRAMLGPRSVFNRFTHEKESCIAYLRATLTESIQEDNVVHHGFSSHLLPRSLTHVLRVCLAAKVEYRIATAVRLEGISEGEARRIIQREDDAAKAWTLHLYGLGPWNRSLYDDFIPMDAVGVDAAVDSICANAAKPPVATTPAALKALEHYRLACRVNVALAEEGHDVEVSADDGGVTLIINRYVMRLDKYEQEIKRIALAVQGVTQVKTRVGPHFNQPNIYPKLDLPTKILLVDDEKEFVHTLSERLQTRNLETAIAYDGEQALSIVETDAPEVMVLDLKMPGIDGLEVLRRVKREHPATEVIILTGHGSETEEKLARDLGAFAYLHKPVDVDVLADTMKQAYRKVAESKAAADPTPEDTSD